MKKIIWCIILIANTVHAQKLYDDNDSYYQNCKSLFLKKDYASLIKSVDNEIQKANPHPFAISYWLRVHELNGDIATALAQYPETLSKKLNLYRQMKEAVDNGDVYAAWQLMTENEYTISDDYYLIYTLHDVPESFDGKRSEELLADFHKKYPHGFAPLRNITTASASLYELYRNYTRRLKEGFFEDTSARNYISLVLKYYPSNDYQRLSALTGYMENHPRDMIALRYMAQLYSAMERKDTAASFFMAAYREDPLMLNNLQSAAEMLAFRQELDSAKTLFDNVVFSFNNETQKLRAEEEWTALLINAGEISKARSALKRMENTHTSSYRYYALSGKMEATCNRWKESAIHYKKSYDLNKSVATLEALIEAYTQLKEYARGIQLMEQEKTHIHFTQSLYYKLFDLYNLSNQKEKSYDAIKEATEKYPNSYWMYGNYAYSTAKRGDTATALTLIKKSLAIIGNNWEWAAYRLKDYLMAENKHNLTQTEKDLEAYMDKNAGSKETCLWSIRYSLKKTFEEKKAVLLQAIQKNPGRIFPFEALRFIYDEANYAELENLLVENEALIMNQGDGYDKMKYHSLKGLMAADRARKYKIGKDEFEKAKANFRHYLDRGGSPSSYYEWMAILYASQEMKDTASICIEKAISYQPDNFILNNKAWAIYSHPRCFQLYKKFYDRNPYDAERAERFIEYNTKWGGSYIIAAGLVEDFKINFPDQAGRIKSEESMIYSGLKDYQSHYLQTYSQATNIAASRRYIGWYENACANAWKGSAKVEIDNKHCSATITNPDGTIYTQTDDTACGKVKRIQVGDVFINASYNKNCNPVSFESSAGLKIQLQYDHDNITSIKNNKDEEVNFEYNALNKPVKITVKNVGYMKVTYDENGKVLSTASYNAKGEEAGYSLAINISRAMQELLGIVDKFKIRNGDITVPDLGIEDAKLATLDSITTEHRELYEERQDAASKKRYLAALNDQAYYLFAHTQMKAGYAVQCANYASEIFMAGKDDKDPAIKDILVNNVSLFHQLMLRIRRRGVASDYWQSWTSMNEWLEREKKMQASLTPLRKKIESLQSKINDEPVKLLASSEWLPKSFLQNESLWKHYDENQFHIQQLNNQLQFQSLYYRSNGDILAGSNKGLFVLRKGYWEHFIWDEISRSLKTFEQGDAISSMSSVNGIAETNEGRLLLGVNGGLISINGDYTSTQTTVFSELDGLPDNIIRNIAAMPDGSIAVQSQKGICQLNEKTVKPIPELQNKTITFLHSETAYDDENNIQPVLIVGADDGVWAAENVNGKLSYRKIVDGLYDDCIYDDEGTPFLLKGADVSRLEHVVDEQGNRKTIPVKVYGNIITTVAGRAVSLCEIPVSENQRAVGALTDAGISLYHEKSFEHFDKFNAFFHKKFLPVKAVSGNGRAAILCNREILLFENNALRYEEGKVNEIIANNQLGKIFISDGSLYAENCAAESNAYNNRETLVNYGNTAFTIDAQNRIIANEGRDIYAFTYDTARQTFSSQLLFSMYAEDEDQYAYNILSASDGTIWVCAKTSLYHFKGSLNALPYNENGYQELTDTFNFHIDSKKFPVYSDWLYKVYEKQDHSIWVVCSNEGHLNYKSMPLTGGLYEWDKEKNCFNKLQLDRNDNRNNGFNWFITSYTPINNDKAILGTLSGFAEETYGSIHNIDYDNTHESYLDLKSKHPKLFLGTQGTQIKDLWLFGCAAGVVMYSDGVWLYPDRLNQMLPEDDLVNYGSRQVNALAIAPNGKLYVGTNLGLLVYDMGDNDPLSFLFNNTDIYKTASYLNRTTLAKERDATLSSISPESNAGKLLANYNKLQGDINKAKQSVAEEDQKKLAGTSIAYTKAQRDSIDRITSEIYKQQAATLLKIQQSEPALYQLLKVDPIDLLSFSKEKLSENEGIIQYIPMANSLFIQLYAKNRIINKQVNVSIKTLTDTIEFVNNYFTRKSGGRGAYVENKDRSSAQDSAKFISTLRYLYDILLKPVAADLALVENIYIVPTGKLFYVPFGALVDGEKQDGQIHFAVEKFNIGYISSVYLLELLRNMRVEYGSNKLVIADPDQSLPGAKAEATDIATMLGAALYTGKKATTGIFKTESKNSRYIHLASHGFLDKGDISNSWLLFADKKLLMSDIFGLSLDKTEMIVLSACETSRGADGIEYATLARAFSNAGVPSVVATLWEVNDASSKQLMTTFYRQLQAGTSKFKALAEAQRSMISSGNKDWMAPYKWAGYIVIGKP